MSAKKTTKQFIEEANLIHGNKYNYEQVDYKGANKNINIYCNICKTIFIKTPNNFLNQKQECSCYKKINKNQHNTKHFIEEATKIHGTKYNYDQVEYINQKTPVIIYCNDCKISFTKPPVRHIHRGVGCPECSITKKITIDEFIKRANEIHGNKYDYTNYILFNDATKSTIKCLTCDNDFEQAPMSHIRSKQGCPICNGGIHISFNDQIIKADIIHGNKYKYQCDNYTTVKQKIDITCTKHGLFKMNFNNHLQGQGCPKCKQVKIGITKEMFLEKVKELPFNYEYDLNGYINSQSYIQIKCPKHGWYKKLAYQLLQGQGCSMCNASKGESIIFNILTDNNIEFETQKRFLDCKDKLPLPFDFFIPPNILIEYDGIQHFDEIEFFGGKEGLESTKLRDNIKTLYCKENSINLIRIKYDDNIQGKLNGITNTPTNASTNKI